MSIKTDPGPLRGIPVTARRRTLTPASSLRAPQTASPRPPVAGGGEHYTFILNVSDTKLLLYDGSKLVRGSDNKMFLRL